jgi:hypothetical protein
LPSTEAFKTRWFSDLFSIGSPFDFAQGDFSLAKNHGSGTVEDFYPVKYSLCEFNGASTSLLFHAPSSGSVGKYHFGCKLAASAAKCQKLLSLSPADKDRRFCHFSLESANFRFKSAFADRPLLYQCASQ